MYNFIPIQKNYPTHWPRKLFLPGTPSHAYIQCYICHRLLHNFRQHCMHRLS